jgi:hypothetical protein
MSRTACRNRWLTWQSVALAALSAVACAQQESATTEVASRPADAGARPAIQTERDVAVLRAADEKFYKGAIVATYTNPTDRTVYLGRCGHSTYPGFTLDKMLASGWTLSYDPICDMVGVPPIEVPPGGSRTDTLPLWETRRPNVYPNFHTGEIPGTYRIAYEVYGKYLDRDGNRSLSDRLPRGEHASARIRIELAPE